MFMIRFILPEYICIYHSTHIKNTMTGEISTADEKSDKTKNGLSIASLVLGIAGFMLSCVGFGIIFGILAIILGSIALYKNQGNKEMSVAGIILGVLSLVGIVIVFLILGFSLFSLYGITSVTSLLHF